MIQRCLFSASAILILGLFLVGCSLPAAATAAAPVQPYAPTTATLAPDIPVGGSADSPRFTLGAQCPIYGNYILELRYSPVDLDITQTALAAESFGDTCSRVEPGFIRCLSTIYPSHLGIGASLTVGYIDGHGSPASASVPFAVPACPAYVVPNVRLLSVECLPGDRVRLVIDEGILTSTHYHSACLGDQRCAGPGSFYYDIVDMRYTLDYHASVWVGPAPTVTSPPLRFILRTYDMSDDADNYIFTLPGFYHSYMMACHSELAPTPAATVPSVAQRPSTGWSLGRIACTPSGGQVIANINYPDALAISSFTANDGKINFTCTDYHIPTHYLVCTGSTTTSPGVLQVNYKDAGTPASITFPEWPSLVPLFCATPLPPTAAPQSGGPSCSDYTDQTSCEAAVVCKWAGYCYKP